MLAHRGTSTDKSRFYLFNQHLIFWGELFFVFDKKNTSSALFKRSLICSSEYLVNPSAPTQATSTFLPVNSSSSLYPDFRAFSPCIIKVSKSPIDGQTKFPSKKLTAAESSHLLFHISPWALRFVTNWIALLNLDLAIRFLGKDYCQ